MKWRFIVGSGLAVCILGLAAGSGFGTLVITEVMSDSLHPAGSANGDWWELTNDGPTDIELGVYSWDDSGAMAGNSVFPEITIGAGESIVIVLGLNDPSAYQAQFGVPPSMTGDTDTDGDLDFDDIQGFVGILNGPGATASLRTIPEPGTLRLLVMGLASLVGFLCRSWRPGRVYRTHNGLSRSRSISDTPETKPARPERNLPAACVPRRRRSDSCAGWE